jgi:hypothetical protein
MLAIILVMDMQPARYAARRVEMLWRDQNGPRVANALHRDGLIREPLQHVALRFDLDANQAIRRYGGEVDPDATLLQHQFVNDARLGEQGTKHRLALGPDALLGD